jgi:hypothetical protein
MFSSGKQTNSCGGPSSFLSEPHNGIFEQAGARLPAQAVENAKIFAALWAKSPDFGRGDGLHSPKSLCINLCKLGITQGNVHGSANRARDYVYQRGMRSTLPPHAAQARLW